LEKDNEIIEKWDEFSDAMKMLEIKENPTIEYWKIWDNIDDIFRVQILQQPDIDYEKYINICDENKKRLLYTNNKKLMSNDLDWDNLSEKLRSSTTLNPNFDFEPYWDRMNDENKRTIINRENFDFDKYWDDLTLSQSLAYLKTSDQYIDEYKMEKIVNSLVENFSFFINIFDFFIDEEPRKFLIVDCSVNEQKLLINVFNKIKIKKIKSLDKDNYNYKLYEYNDNIYIGMGVNVLIKDFYIVQRENKLKRIFKNKR